MSRDLTELFSLVMPAALKRDAALPAVSRNLAFDDLGDFVEERQRITRKLQTIQQTAPKVDFSDFSNHVFFDSAVSKFSIAKDKMFNAYPFAGSSQDLDVYRISGSGYENYVLDNWPRSVGHALYTTSGQSITASDAQGKLYVGTSSLYVSARIAPALPSVSYNVISVLSGSSVSHYYGYTFFVTSTSMTFRVMSGVFQYDYVANFPTASIQNKLTTVAAMYDTNAQQLSLYLDGSKKYTTPINMAGRLSFGPANVVVGSNFSGALSEVRVLHTASELYHFKNYNRPITSENFVKLNYRFNEGNVGDSNVDARVIDYSQSGLHGTAVNYSAGFRQSGSVMLQDPGDPVLYPFHPDVVAFTSSIEDDADLYDATNKNYIFRLIPEDILEDDQAAQELLISFSLAMARYFDELKTYFDQIDNLRVVTNSGYDETPDVMLPLMKKYFGWKVTDHFSDANPLQFLFGEQVLSSGSLGTPLVDIKNQFWRRILSNLPYLYKTKGKRDNISSFFNVLGINSNLVNLKEFGSVTESTIVDDYITKEKSAALLAMGNGQRVLTPLLPTGSAYTIEVMHQLPLINSASLVNDVFAAYQSGSGKSFDLSYTTDGDNSQNATVNFYIPGGDGLNVSAPILPLLNNTLTHFSVKGDVSGNVTVGVRQVTDSKMTLRYTGSYTGATFNPATGSMQVAFGSAFNSGAGGFFSQARVWNRALSEADLDAHAYNFENVADSYLKASGSALQVQYSLSTGSFLDLSRNNRTGVFSGGLPDFSRKELVSYSYLSPSFDLKWTQNKVRIRNKSKLQMADLAHDTNQVALEFNLADALNEDIAKIFSSFDEMNNIIGSAINKYRSEYDDLESYRRLYFSKLTDSLNFTKFFYLFKWFDKKLADSIKQLLPARVDFIGGEFVVDSHMLERNKYQYQYPVFHTPKDVGEGTPSTANFSGSHQRLLSSSMPLQGTTVRTAFDKKYSTVQVPRRESSADFDGTVMRRSINVNGPDQSLPWQKPRNQLPVLGSSSITNNPDYPAGRAFQYTISDDGTVTVVNKGTDTWSVNFDIPWPSGSTLGINYVCYTPTPNDVFSSYQGMTNSPYYATYPTITNNINRLSLSGTAGAGNSGSKYASNFIGCSFTVPGGKTMILAGFRPIDIRPQNSASFVNYNQDPNAIEDSTNSVTYKDEYPRRVFDRRVAYEKNRYVDSRMTNGLWEANGFAFSPVDSDNSEVHYGGIRKSIRLRAMFGNSTGAFALPISPYPNAYYSANTYVVDPNGFAFPPNNFGGNEAFNKYGGNFLNWNINEPKPGAVLRFKISSSNTPVTFANFQPLYTDSGTSWASYYGSSLVMAQSPYQPIANDPGWYQFSFTLTDPYTTSFAIADVIQSNSSNILFGQYVALSGAAFFMKDAYLEFYAPLSDAGVNYYRRLATDRDNKNIRYSNPQLLRDAGAVVFSGSYYPWKNTYFSMSSVAQEQSIVFGNSGKMYTYKGTAAGSAGVNLNSFYVSSDLGATQTLLSSFSYTSSLQFFSRFGFGVDPTHENNFFVCANFPGSNNYTVGTSTDGGQTFKTVFTYGMPTSANGFAQPIFSTAVSSDYYAYFLTEKLLIRGSGTIWTTRTVETSSYLFGARAVYADPNIPGNMYLATATSGYYKSTDHGVNLTQVIPGASNTIAYPGNGGSCAIAPNGWVYFTVTSGAFTTTTPPWILSSSTGNAGTFGGNPVGNDLGQNNGGLYLASDMYSNVYYGYNSGSTTVVYATFNNGATWTMVDKPATVFSNASMTQLTTLPSSPSTVMQIGHGTNQITGQYSSYIRSASLQTNQQSIGPKILKPSFQYVQSQISGVLNVQNKLGNIYEFPHFGGLFQMRHLVLGTKDSGFIGTTDDAIVQVRHVGSVVNVMWPDQSTLMAPVPGFGELTIGQSPGNLATSFTFGTAYDTTEYDHVSLYCYALKNQLGTVEDIELIIQRRPLPSVGFATDQSVQYDSLGSTSIARYKDIIHTKTIDYSDLTATQISYVIDVPLVNVRELRIGVRQKYGQATPNQNFLVWGRFIDSEKET